MPETRNWGKKFEGRLGKYISNKAFVDVEANIYSHHLSVDINIFARVGVIQAGCNYYT